MTRDAENPISADGYAPRALLKSAGQLMLYHARGGGLHLATSTDGLSWSGLPEQVIGPSLTGELSNHYMVALEQDGTYHAWVTGTSQGCIE